MLEAIQEKTNFQDKVDLNLAVTSTEKVNSSQSNYLVVIELIEKYLFYYGISDKVYIRADPNITEKMHISLHS